MILPHGGALVNRILQEYQKDTISKNISKFKLIHLDKEQVKDVKNIARGVYSPLTGYLHEEDFKSVVKKVRLKNGTVWPIPIVLDIDEKKYKELKNENEVLLVDSENNPIALLSEPSFYQYDKKDFAKNVFGTEDKEHPGVEDVYNMEEYLVGGDINLIDNSEELFTEYNLSPRETRELFEKKGWEKIVAFQTRNVPHRGHEFLQMEALKKVDGLFVQPVIGEKKVRDFKDEFIIAAYEALIEHHYPKDKVVLGILPLKMRYAGPREAVFHAIIRKNYGCSHFIVGRDHAGVGDYYGKFEAQEIFEQFKPDEIGVEIVKFDEVVFNKRMKKHTFAYETHEDDRENFSGTKLRESIQNKDIPPDYIVRPVVMDVLNNTLNSFVDKMYKQHSKTKGAVLWFTGLSGSGKSTLADRVFKLLDEKGVKAERLDGDIVRESLTKDLGFSKEDRDENIRRIGFVANLLSKNGVIVLASFISPYKTQREELRAKCHNFIEIYVNTPVKVCEERDVKGLYKKARAGEIKNFTGVDDPYEEPEKAELEVKTEEETVEESVDRVMKFLEENNIINE